MIPKDGLLKMVHRAMEDLILPPLHVSCTTANKYYFGVFLLFFAEIPGQSTTNFPAVFYCKSMKILQMS
jgi:hypothetical protein